MDEQLPWLVFYTKSRHEKKVYDMLLKRGFIAFLPLQKVVRQWSDRRKTVEVPLFNSYIFVKTPLHMINEVCQIPGISWNIRHAGKPAILQEKEYRLIGQFLEIGLPIEITPIGPLSEGEQVEVVGGPLKGAVGRVTYSNPQRFMVILESIGQSMRVDIAREFLKKSPY